MRVPLHRRFSAILACVGLWAVPAWAQGGPADPWAACARAAAAAEEEAGIPAGLLLAIGKAESGRTDLAGRLTPWPYAVNVAGEGRQLPDLDSAIAHVQAAQARGNRSIDTGCFQISLLHHPFAFASLAEAFDPVRNAAYAARFLAMLHGSAGSWEAAAGHYHSMTSGLAEPYAARVMALWAGGGTVPATLAPMARPTPVMAVRVYGPANWALPVAYAMGSRRLPVVYGPAGR